MTTVLCFEENKFPKQNGISMPEKGIVLYKADNWASTT